MKIHLKNPQILRKSRLRIIKLICLLFIFILGNISISIAQQFNWTWVSQVHGTHMDEINAVKSNIRGELLVAGTFYSTAIQWQNTTLINPYENQHNGIYLGMLNTQGNLLWTNSIFCAPDTYISDAYIYDAELNNFGESFISGHVYRNGIIIDTTEILIDDEYSSSGFITKFDAYGNLVWGHVFEDGCNVTSVVADTDGGFYIMGNMYWYCYSIDFGDTILENIPNGNQAYIAHYFSDNTLDWVKTVHGYISDIQGLLTQSNGLLVYGTYQINGYLDTLTIDTLSIQCPFSTYYCSFWGQLNNKGEVQWLKNVAQEDLSVSNLYKTKEGYKRFVWFEPPYIICGADTIFGETESYYAGAILSFDQQGDFENSNSVPIKLGNDFYQLYYSPNDECYAALLLYDSVLCQDAYIVNHALKNDPVILQMDTDFNSIDCYQQDLNYLSYDPAITWDRFGNMILIGSFSADTLEFGDAILTNYQLQTQTDFYLTYGLRCDTTLLTIIYQNGVLQAPPGESWDWYMNYSKIPQETGPVMVPHQVGYYLASATQPDGCVKWTKPFWYDSDSKSVEIFIYPNPTSGNVTILLPESITYCDIYNLEGQLVYKCTSEQQQNIDLRHLPSGNYYVKAGNDSAIFASKFILL